MADSPKHETAAFFKIFACYALILISTIAAHIWGLDGKFLLDDEQAIVHNEQLHELPTLVDALFPPTGEHTGDRWRGPIATLTLAINYRWGGLDPRGYHAVNIAIHALTAFTLFALLVRVLRLDALADRYGNSAIPLALVCTLLWSVHPLTIDSVTYVIQRTGMLVGLFYLLTLYCVVRSASSLTPVPWHMGAVIACALGMLSKESMVTAPFLVLIFDRIFLAGGFVAAIRKRLLLYAGLLATFAPLAWLMSVSPHRSSIGLHLDVTSWMYLKAQCPVLLHYISLAFWPHRLIYDYGRTLEVPISEYLIPGVVIVLLLIATAVLLWRRPKIGFLGAWFFIILAPTSSFIPMVLEVGAERRMYLPLIAIVVGVSISVLEYARNGRPTVSPSRTRALIALAAVAIFALGIRTAAHNRLFADPEALYRTVVAWRPQNWRGHITLGRILFDQKEYAEAELQFLLALEDKPHDPFVHNHLGRVLALKGKYDEAIHNYRSAIELKPNYVKAHYNLAIALQANGWTDAAMRSYRAALEHDPEFAPAHGNLANLLLRQGNTDAAVEEYRSAIEVDPEYVEGHNNLAIVLRHLGDIDGAIAEFEKALAVQPDLAQAHHELGNTLEQRGDLEVALQHQLDACRSAPDWPQPYISAAWLLATHPKSDLRDATESIRLGRRAVELTQGRDARALDALAAGLAAFGQFEQAVATAKRALEVLPVGSHELRAAVGARIELYQSHRVYLMPTP